MSTPVLFARTGWMKYYSGPQVGDERPRRGGKYTEVNVGHEAFNFKDINGKLFGYFQPQMQASTIALERIAPGRIGDSLRGVLVIFVATNPKCGGQRVVGWYRDATVHRRAQSSPATIRNGFNYFLEAATENAVLLPTAERKCRVPSGKNGIGRANICYVYDSAGKLKPMPWVGRVVDFVANYSRENLLASPQAEASSSIVQGLKEDIERAAGFQTNPKIRKVVEMHAMESAETEFRNRGYKVKDVSQTWSYDLLCIKGDETKYVEVKGTQAGGLEVVLTAGEVRFVEEHKQDCILCVVHGIEVKGERAPKASGGHLSLNEPFDISKVTCPPFLVQS
jgi:hypothetical protein